MRRALAGVALSLAAAVSVGACGSSDSTTGSTDAKGGGEAKQEVRVAFLNGLAGNSYAQAVVDGAKAQAAEMGAEIEVLGTPFDAAKQVAQVQDATTAGRFDALVILPSDGNALVPVTKQAVEAGLKVVATFNTIGTDIGSITPGVEGMVATVGEPMVENGRAIANDIVTACEGKSPCRVVYLPGSFKQATEKIRSDAVHEVLESNPHIKVVAEREGGYLQAPALEVTTDILSANPDVDVIATSGDQMTLGAEQAVKNADRTGKITLIGSASSKQGVTAVREGRWFSTPVYLPADEGRIATELAIKAVRGEDVPSSVNTLDLSPVGASATRESLSTERGKSFEGQWNN
jgi:ribose transport system substrate-binding protein